MKSRVLLPGGVLVDGAKSRDPSNADGVDVLQFGLLMGMITESGKYAPSIIGLLTVAYDDDTSTTLTVPTAVAAEIVRRIGPTGTFKLTGPATAAGTVRTITVTYSAVNLTTGVITVTALGTPAVNEVQTVTLAGTLTGGSFLLTLEGITTGPIAYNANLAAIQAALDAAFGASQVVAAGTVASFTLTFSGEDYQHRDVEMVEINVADLIGHAGATVAETTKGTAGVDGRFVLGSVVQPTDGSEVIKIVNGLPYGVKVTDRDKASIDVNLPLAVIGGEISVSGLVNYPPDASLKSWVKVALRAVGGLYKFSDDLAS
jgi:hypothetical protein